MSEAYQKAQEDMPEVRPYDPEAARRTDKIINRTLGVVALVVIGGGGWAAIHFGGQQDAQNEADRKAIIADVQADGLKADPDTIDTESHTLTLDLPMHCKIGEVSFKAVRTDGTITDTKEYTISGTSYPTAQPERIGDITRTTVSGVPVSFTFNNVKELQGSFGQNPCQTIARNTYIVQNES